MHRREVVALNLPTCPGRVVYLAAKAQWDAAWYTDDINKAKVFRHPGLAKATIDAHETSRVEAGLNPRVVSARSVPGYVDRPSAVARRQAREREALDRVLYKIEASLPAKKASSTGCRWCDCEHGGEDGSCTCENYANHRYFPSGG